MNNAYRLVWSHVFNSWVAVAETARGRSKGSGRKLVAAALSLSAVAAQAAPVGGQVVSGSGHIGYSGNTTTINQSSQTLSVNWKGFNIGANETVNFVQPSASAIAVNRIFSTSGTQILGHLNANGQVYLINPNGILFGRGAQINVGGLVASTLNVSDASLGSASRSFSGNGTGSVINEGTITAANGGYVALLGNTVSNQGVIAARLGSVALGAGSAVTLNFGGDSLVSMQVDQSTLNDVAANGGLIQADGGTVVMNAGAQDALLASVVNNTGVIEARTVENHNGTITLLGGMAAGKVNVGGTLDASAPNGGNGGFINTSAEHVTIAPDAKVTTAARVGLTGTWLIDPADYTVAASGGDITGQQLSQELATNNIELESSRGATTGSGNVNIDDTVTWGANTTLTLTASNNVNVNANITATGDTAGLVLNPNTANGTETASGTGTFNLGSGASITLSGANPGLSIAGNSYTVINQLGTAADAASAPATPTLQGVAANPSGYYALGSDIDANGTADWNGGAGFTPIGTPSASFTGTFEGLGHKINNLTIDLPSSDRVGLFGVNGAMGTVRDVGLVGGNVTGSSYVGPLIGANYGHVSNSFATSTVNGSSNVGGLAGANVQTAGDGGTIDNSYASGSVNAPDREDSYVGGLVGWNTGSISNSYSTATVSSGGTIVGGLVGGNDASGTISNSYALGDVDGVLSEDAAVSTNYVGGLVGQNDGMIESSYAIGKVTGGAYAGGLVGFNDGTVSHTFAMGLVSGATYVGGLIGQNYGSVSDSYSTGAASGSNWVGGLVGEASSTASTSNSFWNTTSSGLASSAGGIGLTAAQMQDQANFTSATAANGNVNPNWDFSGTWVMGSGTNPLLSKLLTTVTVQANDVTTTYDGQAYSGNGGATLSAAANSLQGTLAFGGSATGAVNAGTYTITVGGLSSNNPEYIITYVDGTLTVDKAVLTVSGTGVGDKVYDGTNTATLTGGSLAGVIGSDSVTLTQAGTFASSNAGNGIGVTAADMLGGAAAGNYTIMQPGDLSADITPAPLTVSGTSASDKVYDGTNTATLTGGSLAGVIGSDSVTLTQAGTFASSNAGNGVGITAADMLGGAAAGNYMIVQPDGLSANITPAPLTVSGTSANDKVYDGTNTATLTGGSLVGVIGSDSVTLMQAGIFASSNAGNGIGVTAADMLGGAAAGNYTIVQPGGLSANITPAPLTVSGTSAGDKVYDGTNTATLTGGSLVGVIGSDSVTLTQAGIFASSNAGNGIGVTAADMLGGAAAGNYTIVQPGGLSADITPASLVVTASDASKTYGQANPALGVSYSGFVNGETSANLSTQADASTTANGSSGVGQYAITAAGAIDPNYTISYSSGTLTVNPAILTVSGTSASDKVYDGTTAATLTGGSLVGLVNGDTVALTQAGNFGSANAGTGIGITATDSLGGGAAGNYVIVQPTGLSANITPAPLTVSGTSASDKVYDGTNAATLSGGSLVGLIGSDSVTLTQTGLFASRNVGNGLGVTATDSLSGTAAGNYSIVEPTGLNASITPASLTYIAAAGSVVVGQSPAGLSGTVSGFVGGDTLADATSGTLAWTTTADASSQPGSYAVDGGGLTAQNYVFLQAAGNASALSVTQVVTPPPTGGSGGTTPPLSGPGGTTPPMGVPTGSTPPISVPVATTPLPQVQTTVTQLVANMVAQQSGNGPQMLTASSTITVTPTADTGTAVSTAAPNAATSESTASLVSSGTDSNTPVVSMTMDIGGKGTLRVENQGVKLPENLASLNGH